MADFLKTLNPDVMCLQELTTTSADNPEIDVPHIIAGRLGAHLVYREAQRMVKDGFTWHAQGNAILSRYPLLRPRAVFIQEIENEDPAFDAQGRLYVEAQVQAPDGIATVATTHMSFVPGFEEAPRRSREDDRLVEAIGTSRKGYVFTGDLNSLPSSELVRRLPGRTGLRDLGPGYEAKTWTTKPFTDGGSVSNTLDYRLDYVFGSQDVQVISAEVIKTELSDHLPILVTVEL